MKIKAQIHKNFSICEEPSEIDARVVNTNITWTTSGSVLIHPSEVEEDSWIIGISKKG